MRVWALSDLHTDYRQNLEWVQQLTAASSSSRSENGNSGSAGADADPIGSGNGGGTAAAAAAASFRNDIVVLAGDVSDALDTLEQTLQLFAAAFGHVFFVPGNHDLWVRRGERGKYDSLGKLEAVSALCRRLGVHTEPACVAGVWIVPILSWYHPSWDKEPDVPGSRPINKAGGAAAAAARPPARPPTCLPVMLDFHACTWESAPQPLSAEDDSLARHFDGLNEPAFSAALECIAEQAAAAGGTRPPIISFSHFLPRQELLPEKRMLYYPNLAKASGSDFIEARIRRLRPLAHVFGHTHFSWDAELEGVRYVQWPLGYPHEQRRRHNGGADWRPLALYDSAAGGLTSPRRCYWSDHYCLYPRDPSNVTPAPWVSA